MYLDLRSIIDIPGGKIEFDYEPDMSDETFDSITSFITLPHVIGNVLNRAGVLTLTAQLDAVCKCVCARCLKEFECPINMQITAYITEENEESQNTDNYFYKDDKVNLDEIIITELHLNIDEIILCQEDCLGLCQKCGSDLNKGLCGCKKDVDPRLAKLAELL
jgi:uncharacterized protein